VIRLNTEDICDGLDNIDNLECIICKFVLIQPMECNKCDGLFCNECLEEHANKTTGRNSSKCPQCK